MIVKDRNSAVEGILLAMVILLSLALAYLLKRKRTKLTPDFVQVQRSALQHKMAAMPHASFDEEASSIDFGFTLKRATLFEDDDGESYTRRRSGPFDDDDSTVSGFSDSSSKVEGVHII